MFIAVFPCIFGFVSYWYISDQQATCQSVTFFLSVTLMCRVRPYWHQTMSAPTISATKEFCVRQYWPHTIDTWGPKKFKCTETASSEEIYSLERAT